MNPLNLIKFKNHLNTLINNQPRKNIQDSIKNLAILFGLSVFFWVLGAILSHVDHLSLHSLIGFPVFLMQEIASMSHLLWPAFALVCFINLVINTNEIIKNINFKKALKEISGENIKIFFDDLYQACENNPNVKYALQQVVNNLAANKHVSLVNLEFIYKHLNKTLTNVEVESENIDYFSQFEKETKNKNFKVDKEEPKIQFFTAN